MRSTARVYITIPISESIIFGNTTSGYEQKFLGGWLYRVDEILGGGVVLHRECCGQDRRDTCQRLAFRKRINPIARWNGTAPSGDHRARSEASLAERRSL